MVEKTFMTVDEVCKITGLSKYYLRNGIASGNIPHIRCGKAIKINLPLLMDKLNNESLERKLANEYI